LGFGGLFAGIVQYVDLQIYLPTFVLFKLYSRRKANIFFVSYIVSNYHS